ELLEIADFLCIEHAAVDRLVGALFQRPPGAEQALAQDTLVDTAVLKGGPLVENSGRNLYQFQHTLDSMDGISQELWREMFMLMLKTPNSCLIHLAQKALAGAASLPPMVKTGAFRGEAAHAAGLCRPCVFHLRGICRDTAETCLYCHADGHDRTKRASHKVRKQRQAQRRMRTPSPDRF
ncbi:unnamed protein product, partial [Effrenium voratum]